MAATSCNVARLHTIHPDGPRSPKVRSSYDVVKAGVTVAYVNIFNKIKRKAKINYFKTVLEENKCNTKTDIGVEEKLRLSRALCVIKQVTYHLPKESAYIVLFITSSSYYKFYKKRTRKIYETNCSFWTTVYLL